MSSKRPGIVTRLKQWFKKQWHPPPSTAERQEQVEPPNEWRIEHDFIKEEQVATRIAGEDAFQSVASAYRIGQRPRLKIPPPPMEAPPEAADLLAAMRQLRSKSVKSQLPRIDSARLVPIIPSPRSSSSPVESLKSNPCSVPTTPIPPFHSDTKSVLSPTADISTALVSVNATPLSPRDDAVTAILDIYETDHISPRHPSIQATPLSRNVSKRNTPTSWRNGVFLQGKKESLRVKRQTGNALQERYKSKGLLE